MATKKEINEHLNIALAEVGAITPWYDRRFRNWIFSSSKYPVEYAGTTKDDVITNYPLYLREFIKQRLNDNLSPITEKETKGRGGKREGAGRPIGTSNEHKIRVYLPDDIALWFKKHPNSIDQIRQAMRKII